MKEAKLKTLEQTDNVSLYSICFDGNESGSGDGIDFKRFAGDEVFSRFRWVEGVVAVGEPFETEVVKHCGVARSTSIALLNIQPYGSIREDAE